MHIDSRTLEGVPAGSF